MTEALLLTRAQPQWYNAAVKLERCPSGLRSTPGKRVEALKPSLQGSNPCRSVPFPAVPVPFSPVTAPRAPIPSRGERVLILAPHPDDETLGAGGWIHSARRNGAEVRILFLTDGDAFRLAALTALRRLPNQAACRDLGERRRDEARAAAAELGVDASSLRFLGYPDRGLEPLRLREASGSGYRSPHTGRPYKSADLRHELLAALEEYRPRYLLFSHSEDDHPDHRAAAWFAEQALRRLRGDRPTWIGSYLIHCGRWPLPHRFAVREPLRPPDRLDAVEQSWMCHPLTATELQAKARALRAHSTQHLWAADLLGAHLRTNELFSRK